MRTIVLTTILSIWTLSGIGQGSKCFNTEEQIRILQAISERDSLLKIVEIYGNNELMYNDQIESLTLQNESYARTVMLFEDESTARGKEIIKTYSRIKELTDQVEKYERKIRRLKRQRWVFGGVGILAGLILPVLI